jgi:hypothetical protein
METDKRERRREQEEKVMGLVKEEKREYEGSEG